MKTLVPLFLLAALVVSVTVQLPAQAARVTGQVVCLYCVSTMGMKRPYHAKCGQICAMGHVPVGILEKRTAKVYLILPSEHPIVGEMPADVAALARKMGKQVTVQGKVVRRLGISAIVLSRRAAIRAPQSH